MRGQFIDMQPTRGGVPARLYQAGVRRCDVERIGVPYVVGRIGWTKCKNPTPLDVVYCHCTDKQKVSDYSTCMSILHCVEWRDLLSSEKELFRVLTDKWVFKYPKSMRKIVNELMS